MNIVSVYFIGYATAALMLGAMLTNPPAVNAKLIPDQLVPKECTLNAISTKFGGCTVCHLGALIINITNFLMYGIALPSAALMVAVGGITILVSGSSETLLKRGKQTLTYAVGGILIVFLAWIAVDTIIKTLTLGGTNFRGTFGPWQQLPVETCDIK